MTFRSLRRSITLVILLFGILAVLLPVSAQETFSLPDDTLWGDPQDLGDGQIQTFVTLDELGNPSLVGLYFTEAALSGLPEEMGDGHWDVLDANGKVIIPCCGHEVVLDLPETETPLVFEHVVSNWNPMGHMPAKVYDVPHFDMHFYTISNEDRMAIKSATADTMCSVPNPPDVGGEHPVGVTCETLEEARLPLPDDQLPPGYISADAIEAGMGNHLINSQAPEMAGEPFTHTWIYGIYGGRITFYEPMITLAFLEEKNEEVCSEIAMPEAMPEPGFYPSQYCIRYLPGDTDGEGVYIVSLESFVEF
jgi:hypothetical protein